MQPSKLSITDLFQPREQHLIPLFQRGYVWKLDDQIEPLWIDIIDRVEALKAHRENMRNVIGGVDRLKPLRKHFFGALVVGSPVSVDSQVIATREVIDGQQRITTLQLMLLALRDVLRPHEDTALGDDVALLTFNKGKYRSKTDHLKVMPTNVGREEMRIIESAGSIAEVCKRFPVRNEAKARIERPLMVQVYLFFHAMLECYLRGKRYDDAVPDAVVADEDTIARAVIRSIGKHNELKVPFIELPTYLGNAHLLIDALQNCFMMMRLQLDAEDDPQIIFETLNARGAPLQPSDLIRNYLFLSASRNGEKVDELYDNYWRQFDEKEAKEGARSVKFWKLEQRQGRLKNSRLDLLLYHYVGLRKREDLKVSHVFEEFKDWWESNAANTASELGRLSALAKHFEVFMAPDQKSRFGHFCRRMSLLDTATQTPLVFHLLEHHEPSAPDFLTAIGELESYFVRRFICGLTTKGYNRIFLNRLLAEMVNEKKADAATLRSKLKALEGDSQRWPDDKEFKAAWSYRQLYQGSNTRKVRAVLEGLEFTSRSTRQEFMPELEQLSVEHVLPQRWKPEKWPLKTDTPEGREARSRLLHSIGNLTLVTPGFNSELSNESFGIKRPEIARNSSLVLNAYFQDFKDTDEWDETSIVARADKLFPVAVQTWGYPG